MSEEMLSACIPVVIEPESGSAAAWLRVSNSFVDDGSGARQGQYKDRHKAVLSFAAQPQGPCLKIDVCAPLSDTPLGILSGKVRWRCPPRRSCPHAASQQVHFWDTLLAQCPARGGVECPREKLTRDHATTAQVKVEFDSTSVVCRPRVFVIQVECDTSAKAAHATAPIAPSSAPSSSAPLPPSAEQATIPRRTASSKHRGGRHNNRLEKSHIIADMLVGVSFLKIQHRNNSSRVTGSLTGCVLHASDGPSSV